MVGETTARLEHQASKESSYEPRESRCLPSPLAEARDYQASLEAGMDVEDVAAQASRSVAHVKHRLKILELAPRYE
jgi:hypothetical protein